MRRIPAALLISLGLHVGLVAGALVFLHRDRGAADAPDKQVMVELVLEERRGEARPPALPQPPAPPLTVETPAVEPQMATPPMETKPKVEMAREAMPPPRETAMAPPLPEPIQPEKAQKQDKAIPPASSPEPAASPPAMTITLSGTDSPSNALAQGEQIIPAAADAVFHNRQPLYPLEALRRGQHGAVVVVVHVAPSGRAAGADVVSSSGHMLLDRAAREAVLTWRFLPAMKGGRAVASDLPMRFIFEEE